MQRLPAHWTGDGLTFSLSWTKLTASGTQAIGMPCRFRATGGRRWIDDRLGRLRNFSHFFQKNVQHFAFMFVCVSSIKPNHITGFLLTCNTQQCRMRRNKIKSNKKIIPLIYWHTFSAASSEALPKIGTGVVCSFDWVNMANRPGFRAGLRAGFVVSKPQRRV
ncbi:hypothetical protein [Thiomonas sp.]|uniref:hypothetical protein n=1 Tax=Thiomonas sp. TaxID=2047785 RepID=UPI0026077608|nr:hypothetical protein [Thiomonas sp.]